MKTKVRRKKTAPIESAPSKPTATFYSDQIIGSENLSVGSSVKIEIEGKVIDERINIYNKPQKKSFEIEVHKAKVLD